MHQRLSNITTKHIEKLAKDPSLVSDFVAGFDPTLTATTALAKKTEKNIPLHRAVQDVGSFASAAVSGSLATAAGTGALALALKKRDPVLAQKFSESMKGALESLNLKKKLAGGAETKLLEDPIAAASLGAGLFSGAIDAVTTDMQYRRTLRERAIEKQISK